MKRTELNNLDGWIYDLTFGPQIIPSNGSENVKEEDAFES